MAFSTTTTVAIPNITMPVVQPQVHAAITREVEVKEITSSDYQPITDPKNVEKFLNDYFSDIPILAKVGACESHNRQYGSSGAVLRGEKNVYDRGVMQINILYHAEEAVKQGLDLNNIDDNVAFARYLYEKYGTKPWASSSGCWSRFASGSDIQVAIAKK